MPLRSAVAATFSIERAYAASPARVFNAVAKQEAKSHWFSCPGGTTDTQEFDFRVGGREYAVSRLQGDGIARVFNARYFDIVPNERIVYAYDMLFDTTRISVSLTTIELKAEGSGTRLVFTEQGVFLDGYDGADLREAGTRGLLEALDTALQREPVNA